MYDVLVIGDLMLELFLPLAHGLRANECVTRDYARADIGGGALNAAVHLAQLGRRVALCAVVPPAYARQVSAILRERRISTRSLLKDGQYLDYLIVLAQSNAYEALYLRDHGRPGLFKSLAGNAASARALVAVGTRRSQLRQASARLAREGRFAWTLFSPSYPLLEYRRAEAARMIRSSAVTVVNDKEYEWLAANGLADRADALVVTRNEDGAEVIRRGQVTRRLPRLSAVRGDKIGTGDAFAAGLAEGYLRGLDLWDSSVLGATIAARVAESGELRPRLSAGEIERSFAVNLQLLR